MSRIGCAWASTASQTPIASILRLRLAERGIDYGHLEARAERLTQRDSRRQAGETGTANDHIGFLNVLSHQAFLRLPCNIRRSIAG
jgi:hypothetical protein